MHTLEWLLGEQMFVAHFAALPFCTWENRTTKWKKCEYGTNEQIIMWLSNWLCVKLWELFFIHLLWTLISIRVWLRYIKYCHCILTAMHWNSSKEKIEILNSQELRSFWCIFIKISRYFLRIICKRIYIYPTALHSRCSVWTIFYE